MGGFGRSVFLCLINTDTLVTYLLHSLTLANTTLVGYRRNSIVTGPLQALIFDLFAWQLNEGNSSRACGAGSPFGGSFRDLSLSSWRRLPLVPFPLSLSPRLA